jgi:hypothetical protein
MLSKKKNFSTYKHTILLGIAFLLFQCSIIQVVQSQEELNRLRSMWREERYSEVVPLLIEYRYNKPYGKNIEVDYMIATSACRTSNLRQEGYKFFRWILSHYRLYKSNQRLVENEMERCDSSPRPIYFDFVTLWSTWGPAGAKGKTYYWIDSKNAAIANDPVEVVRELTREELNERLFQIPQRNSAIEFVGNLVGSRFKIESVGHFLIASASGHSQAELRTLGLNLERYLHFFSSQYQMTIPPYFITIYLVPYIEKLQDLAENIHGIRVSESSIGYSFRDDLSIVGVIPRMLYGTIAHELFHLMVRNNFGDIPPWMDEGMAALYEVSRITDEGIIGLPNWRGVILEKFWNLRPSIKKLVEMDWLSFDNVEGDYEAKQQATNHATARYFILYLQDKQKLVEVYNAFRQRKVEDIEIDPGADAVELIESVLQKPLSEVDEDFVKWFNNISR